MHLNRDERRGEAHGERKEECASANVGKQIRLPLLTLLS